MLRRMTSYKKRPRPKDGAASHTKAGPGLSGVSSCLDTVITARIADLGKVIERSGGVVTDIHAGRSFLPCTGLISEFFISI